jgi:hypothetical protein
MKQTTSIHESRTVAAAPVRAPLRLMNEADLDKVSGGGGALGGVIHMRGQA